MDYFASFYARNHTVIPGIGTIFTQGVSNAYTSSLEHMFKAEGAEKAVRGRVLFGVRIADDGSTHWVVEEITGPSTRRLAYNDPRPTEADQTDFPAEAMAEMRRLSETYCESSPTGWFFDVLQRAEDDLKHLDREREQIARGIETRTELLADPNEPRRHFVSKEQAGPDATKGFMRASTADERAERRAWWTAENERARARLEAHDAGQGRRTAMLRAIVRDLRIWSNTSPRNQRRSPVDVVAEAVASIDAPIAA